MHVHTGPAHTYMHTHTHTRTHTVQCILTYLRYIKHMQNADILCITPTDLHVLYVHIIPLVSTSVAENMEYRAGTVSHIIS